jgi:hypothetical protein
MAKPLLARQIDGVSFPDNVTLDGSDVPLQLNGMGYRVKFVFDVYILGFYTESKVDSRDSAQALKGPKRIIMHMVRDEVSRDKMISALNDGFEQNTTDAQLASLESRIKQFSTFFPDLVKDDVVILDYIPGVGTRVSVNDGVKGTIEGVDFYPALLDIWLGDEPADDDLKDAMLGVEG